MEKPHKKLDVWKKEIIVELVRVDKMLSGLIRSLKKQTPDA